MEKNFNILIAGAGIGGLTAAACLLQQGFNVRIYEQAAELGEVGAGLQTSANAVKVLYALGLREALERVAVRPHPTIQTVIDAIDRDACYRYALNNRPPVTNWSSSRATLLGDAAHPTLPYLASGAVMAIEDSAVLTRCLSEQLDDVPAALQRYQRHRPPRTARIVNGSTDSRALYRIEDVAQMRQAFHDQDLNKARSEWLYSYDPWTVPLV